MIKIGLTGGIACGKTTAGKWFAEQCGWEVLDTDHVAHELLMPGNPVCDSVIEEFGQGILDDNGLISRPLLGELVFNNPDRLHVLNELMHPAVRKETIRWLSRQHTTAVVMIPLLFEKSLQDDFDLVISISASVETQIRRLKERGHSVDEAKKRIAAQMPMFEKNTKSDFVIYNDKSLTLLFQQLKRVAHALEENTNGR
jgi:dephospho-CoA kinase